MRTFDLGSLILAKLLDRDCDVRLRAFEDSKARTADRFIMDMYSKMATKNLYI